MSSEGRNKVEIQVCLTPDALLLTTVKTWVDLMLMRFTFQGESQTNKDDRNVVTAKVLINFSYTAVIPIAQKLLSEAFHYSQIILKSRDITLPTKVCLVKAMFLPVVMYGCESWTVKKAECRKIDVFELRCWKTLESPMDCMEIQPVHSKGDQSWVFFGRK